MGEGAAVTQVAAHAVTMRGVSKAFGGVRALVDVDFEVAAGEIHALLGENGAGKSTILKVLNGVHVPDEGTVEVNGVRLGDGDPETSRKAGIAMIFQEMSLVPTLTVAQNIALTRETRSRLGLIDDAASVARARRWFDALGAKVDPDALVGALGAGQRQLTEIVKAISQDARVLILDEPTTALSAEDVDRLFAFLQRLKADGVAIIYVSHRMDEITRIADRATILRDGRKVITADLADLPLETMIEHIVGKRSRGLSDVTRSDATRGDALLELKGASGREKPRDIDLTVHRGEVVGVAGLLGSGRSALARIIAGIDPLASGEVLVGGERALFRSPADAIARGIALVPEDRLRQGLIPAHSVAANMTMAVVDRLSRFAFVDRKRTRDLTDRQIERLRVKTASRDAPVRTLSGGNAQKVVIGKWLATEPDILILDEPTAGIDIGSKAEIIGLVRDLARSGKAILMISSELSELLAASDRIAVMAGGRIAAMIERRDLDDAAPSEDDPVLRLQAAERRLQIAVQQAVTRKAAEAYFLRPPASEHRHGH
jgi:ribose transport system ATP-binding protein